MTDAPVDKIDEKVVQDEVLEQEDFTLEQAKNWWKTYADERKKAGRDLEYLILNQEITLNGNDIVIKPSNSVQEQMLDGFRTQLIQFMRSKLRNSTINLSVELDVGTSRRMIYTPMEKFKHLAEKNSALLDLKNRLQLEID